MSQNVTNLTLIETTSNVTLQSPASGEDVLPPSDPDHHVVYIFGGVFTFVGIIIVAIIIWVYKRKPWNRSDYVQPMKDDSPSESLLLQNLPIKIPDENLIDPDRLVIEDRIGNGRFGNVYQGVLKKNKNDPDEGELVAVKAVRPSWVEDEEQVNQFLREGQTMCVMGSHQHVLSLIGIILKYPEVDSTSVSGPLILMPMMPNGDLHSHVSDPEKAPEISLLLEWAYQIADGMSYLASNSVIHRDLAARNCLLDSNYRIKIADFGVSRQTQGRYYYAQNRNIFLPWAWMPPEIFTGKKKFSEKTDVWSFGVLVWELMSKGQAPYGEHDQVSGITQIILGKLLKKPKQCPSAVYDKIIMRCWAKDSRSRPHFEELKDIIQNVSNSLSS